MSTIELKRAGRRRPGIVALGLSLIVTAGLGGAVLIRYSTASVAVLALSDDMQRGQILTAADLRVVELTPSPGVSWLAPAEQGRLIGSAAAGPLGAGQLVVPSMFVSRPSAIGAGNVLMAIALRPGDIPRSVRIGDRVRLHLLDADLFNGSAGVVGLPVDTAGREADAIGEALVWAVETPSGSEIIVSLLVDERIEATLSQGSMVGRFKLNIVGGAG